MLIPLKTMIIFKTILIFIMAYVCSLFRPDFLAHVRAIDCDDYFSRIAVLFRFSQVMNVVLIDEYELKNKTMIFFY